MAQPPPAAGKFSELLLTGLDHYRKGKMMEAVRAWEEAYRLEPTNLRAREFLRSALERIHAHLAPGQAGGAAAQHPWLNGKGEAPGEPAAGAMPGSAPAAGAVLAGEISGARSAPAAGSAGSSSAQADAAAAARRASRIPTGPWDDGPSVALPQEQPQSAGDESSGAWSIHKDQKPDEAGASDEVNVWIRGARELMALNDFSGALELTGKILARKPGHKEAQKIHEQCEHNLTLMYESKIGSMEARPVVSIQPDEIIWLNLDPRAGFVLAQIDGQVSFEDLYAICGLKRLDTARILSQLLEEGIVAVAGEQQAVAKRALHRR